LLSPDLADKSRLFVKPEDTIISAEINADLTQPATGFDEPTNLASEPARYMQETVSSFTNKLERQLNKKEIAEAQEATNSLVPKLMTVRADTEENEGRPFISTYDHFAKTLEFMTCQSPQAYKSPSHFPTLLSRDKDEATQTIDADSKTKP